MSKDMLGSLTRASVRLTQSQVALSLDVMNRFTGHDGKVWEAHIKSVLRAGLPHQVEQQEAPTKLLLEEVGTPAELAAVARFVAREKFVVDVNGELPISWLGENFQTRFLGVVEENVPATTLRQRKLLEASSDASILTALGDTDLTKIEKARVALAHVFEFLKSADRSRWFLFYVPDATGTVWAVSASWRDGGWYLAAYSVESPLGWYADDRVVSR